MCMRRSGSTRTRARALVRLCGDGAGGRTAAAECGMCRCAANSKAFFSCDRAHEGGVGLSCPPSSPRGGVQTDNARSAMTCSPPALQQADTPDDA
jgi:hypothetical protein